jgi:hypothetical protein
MGSGHQSTVCSYLRRAFRYVVATREPFRLNGHRFYVQCAVHCHLSLAIRRALSVTLVLLRIASITQIKSQHSLVLCPPYDPPFMFCDFESPYDAYSKRSSYFMLGSVISIR